MIEKNSFPFCNFMKDSVFFPVFGHLSVKMHISPAITKTNRKQKKRDVCYEKTDIDHGGDPHRVRVCGKCRRPASRRACRRGVAARRAGDGLCYPRLRRKDRGLSQGRKCAHADHTNAHRVAPACRRQKAARRRGRPRPANTGKAVGRLLQLTTACNVYPFGRRRIPRYDACIYHAEHTEVNSERHVPARSDCRK